MVVWASASTEDKKGETVRRSLLSVTVALWIAGFATVAAAQEAPDERLIQRGLEARREGRDEEALGLFRQAYTLRATPRALAQIGLAEQALGRWVEADEDLRRALSFGDDVWIQEAGPVLERSLQQIEPHIGRLEVVGNVTGAEVRVNGRVVGTLPLSSPVPLPVGEAIVQVVAEGYYPIARRAIVTAEGIAHENVELQAVTRLPDVLVPVAPTTVTATSVRPRLDISPTRDAPDSTLAFRRTMGWVSAGGAALFGGGGLALLLLGNSDIEYYNSLDCLPTNGASRGETCSAELDRGKMLQTLGVTALGFGGAAAVTSVVLFVISRQPRSASTAVRAWAACALVPWGGVTCQGVF